MSSKDTEAISAITDNMSSETLFGERLLDAVLTANDFSSPYTAFRTQRVVRWSKILSQLLEFESVSVREVEIAALLCDIGMWAIPPEILNKKGRLTLSEFRLVQLHPEMSLKVLQDINLNGRIRANILHHHESYDGSGYPNGLRGREIPLGAQIVNVACALFAITAERPYREPVTPDKAMKIISSEENHQFNPNVVKACIQMHDEGQIKSVLHMKVENPFKEINDSWSDDSSTDTPKRTISSIVNEQSSDKSASFDDSLRSIREALDEDN